MTTTSEIGSVQPLSRRRKDLSTAIWRLVRRRFLGVVGASILLLMVVAAVFADVVAPQSPFETDFLSQLKPPGPEHLLGADEFGRDVLSRIIFGARTALLVGLGSSLIGTGLGAILGVSSAYFAGKTDMVIQRLMDLLQSFPMIILAIAFLAALGSGVTNVIVAITIPMVPYATRVVRSSAMTVRSMLYVEAARSLGASHARIIFRHLLPNVLAPLLIVVTAFLGQAILLEAALSFLGLGVNEPTPAWGLMLRGAGVRFAESAPWLALAPGIAISLAVLAFNLLGDSLRDELDPKLRI